MSTMYTRYNVHEVYMVKRQKNIFGQTICNKGCIAWNSEHGFCEANLDYEGNVLPENVNGKLTRRFGTLCTLPTKFRIVLSNGDDIT